MSNPTAPICEICHAKKDDQVVDLKKVPNLLLSSFRYAHQSCLEGQSSQGLGNAPGYNEQNL